MNWKKYVAAAASALAALAVASANMATIRESLSKVFGAKSTDVKLSLIDLRISPAGSKSIDMGGHRHRPLQFVIDKIGETTLKGCYVEALVDNVSVPIVKYQPAENWDTTPQEKFSIHSARTLVKVSISVDMTYEGHAAVRVLCDSYVTDLAMADVPEYDPLAWEAN